MGGFHTQTDRCVYLYAITDSYTDVEGRMGSKRQQEVFLRDRNFTVGQECEFGMWSAECGMRTCSYVLDSSCVFNSA